RFAQNRSNCFMCCFYQFLTKPNLFSVSLYIYCTSFGPRIRSKMSGHREKRSKCQHDPNVHMADDDEGGSSQLNVVSGRQLRSRKRSAMWQNHLNYLGSSVLAITIKATPTQTHF